MTNPICSQNISICSWRNSDYSCPLSQKYTKKNVFSQKKLWKNSDQSHMLLKEFWPISPAPEKILTNPAHSWKTSDQSRSFSKEFWPIPPAPEGIWTDPAHSWMNSDESCVLSEEFQQPHLLLREFRPNSLALKGILSNPSTCDRIMTNPTCFWRYNDQFHLLQKALWPILSTSRRNSDKSCFLSKEFWSNPPFLMEF